jgi:tetratricopeptide (TPR) repeat protein
MSTPLTEEQLLSKAWGLFAKDDYAGVLNICRSAYAQGLRTYDLVRLMLDSLNKLGKVQEQAEVTLKVLGENHYPPKVAAKHYFRAGLIYQHQEDVAEARRIFEQVRLLDPDFPGIEQRIKALTPRPVASSSSRYSYLLEKGVITAEQLSRVLSSDSKDPDGALIKEHKVSKKDLGESLPASTARNSCRSPRPRSRPSSFSRNGVWTPTFSSATAGSRFPRTAPPSPSS